MARAEIVRTREYGSEPWTTLAGSIGYEPLGGPAKTLTFGNGYVLTRGYDLHYLSRTVIELTGGQILPDVNDG